MLSLSFFVARGDMESLLSPVEILVVDFEQDLVGTACFEVRLLPFQCLCFSVGPPSSSWALQLNCSPVVTPCKAETVPREDGDDVCEEREDGRGGSSQVERLKSVPNRGEAGTCPSVVQEVPGRVLPFTVVDGSESFLRLD